MAHEEEQRRFKVFLEDRIIVMIQAYSYRKASGNIYFVLPEGEEKSVVAEFSIAQVKAIVRMDGYLQHELL